MSDIYLISQLPSLDGLNDDLQMPITEERFLELCDRFLGKSVRRKIEKITLLPPINQEKTGSALIDEWNEGERNLRLALAKIRAEKMGKSFDSENILLSNELMSVANEAVEIDNPMEAEKFLLQYRLAFLEKLRPMDYFSENFIYYYGIRLKLLSRERQFDLHAGAETYKNIYNSILSGDSLEAIQ